MNRKTLDMLLASVGGAIAVVLLVGGGLLTWAHSFVNAQVTEQLSAQRITMPDKAALETDEQRDALAKYAGQQLTTGAQAKAFADQYILVHMNASSDGRTYEEVSGEFMALSKDPNADKAEVEELGALRESLFMGNSLRGLLLNAYAFWMMGQIAFYGALAAFGGAALMLVLSLLGVAHARKVGAATVS